MMGFDNKHRSGLRGALFVVAFLYCAVAAADLQKTVNFNIAPQLLQEALIKYSAQSGVQITSPASLITGKSSGGVTGRLPARSALARLLQGTDLTYEVINDSTVTIRLSGAAKRGKGETVKGAANEAGDAGLLLAQGEAAKADDGVEEMLVEGERDKPAPFSTANLDLTRTEDDVLPFTVFTARDIELSGAASLQDFLESRLPQNFSSVVAAEDGGDGRNNSAFNAIWAPSGQVSMRGWGAGETVFLLNGRRMASQYQRESDDTTNATPNLQGIPLGAIERIEILSSAGSAIYGANATGGVINIITRQDFRGGQLTANYESPADVHAPRRGVDLSYGLPLKWGVSLRLGAGYNQSEPLRSVDRADVSIMRWRRLAMERDLVRFLSGTAANPLMTTTRVHGATPNIHTGTTAGGNLFSGLPGALASNYTSVPAGSTGNTSLSGYRPGVYNIEQAEGAAGNYVYAKDSTLGMITRNIALNVGIDKSFASGWRGSLDYRYSDSNPPGATSSYSSALTFQNADPASSRPLIPRSAPGNPFGQDVQVFLVDPRLNRPELLQGSGNISWEVSSTLRGELGNWRMLADATYAHNRNQYTENQFLEPNGGWRQAFLTGAYNPFVDVRVVAPAAPAFYENYIASRYFADSATRTYQTALKASGPVLRLPAGEALLTAGISGARVDRYHSSYATLYLDGMTGEPRTPVSAIASAPLYDHTYARFKFDSYAAYAETSMPLIAGHQNIVFMEGLEVFASGRMDHTIRNGFRSQSRVDQNNGIPPAPVRYTDTSHLYAYGLRYDIFEGLALRATRSLGFKPPNISQITPALNAPTGVQRGLNDPIRDPLKLANDVELSAGMYVSGGNPDLRPESTDSTNFGVIFRMPQVPGLRVSVDYVENVRNDAIFSISAQEAINLEREFPQLVRRGLADGHASGVGRIIFVDQRMLNLRQVASTSVDFSVEQQFPNVFGGRLLLNALASKNLSFRVQASNTGPAVEQIRNTEGLIVSQQIEWNANGQLRWEGQHWGIGWSARYFDYILVSSARQLLQAGDRAPWKVDHDLNVSYRTAALQNPRGMQWLLSGTSLTLGVKNVFNREPRFWADAPRDSRGIAPFDSLMGRSIWLQIRKSFE